MRERIDVTVAAVIEQNGHFLTVEEECRGRIVLNQPAGHLEPGESLIEAVIRETREETGFGFEPTQIVGIYLWHSDEAGRSFLRLTFTGRGTAPFAEPELDEGIIAAHWLSRSELLRRESQLRSPLVVRAIDDYLAGARFPLEALSYLDREFSVNVKTA